jgi:hypothetical protein
VYQVAFQKVSKEWRVWANSKRAKQEYEDAKKFWTDVVLCARWSLLPSDTRPSFDKYVKTNLGALSSFERFKDAYFIALMKQVFRQADAKWVEYVGYAYRILKSDPKRKFKVDLDWNFLDLRKKGATKVSTTFDISITFTFGDPVKLEK